MHKRLEVQATLINSMCNYSKPYTLQHLRVNTLLSSQCHLSLPPPPRTVQHMALMSKYDCRKSAKRSFREQSTSSLALTHSTSRPWCC